MNRIKKTVSLRINAVNKRRKVYYGRFMARAQRKPISTFLALLLILLGLIILSNAISKPKITTEETTLPTKSVAVYTIGTSPKLSVQAQIEKSGVIKIVSLGSGIVQSINAEVGQDVYQGTTLISMSTNYQGGNAMSVARQLAEVQYKNVVDTYKVQKDLIKQQVDLANKSDENSDKLREISNNSTSGTQSLIDLNNDILSTLAAQQADLEATNVGGANDAAILQTKQLRAQLQAGNNQLQTALKTTQFTGSDTNAPAEISNISKTIAIEQLYAQQKALELNKEVSRLSLLMAQINEAIMFPSSPINGVVERIYVREGQAVTPGTPLAQVSGDSKSLIAVASLSREMAQGISRSGMSVLHIGDKTYESAPFYVSTEATDGQLYTAEFQIPQEYTSQVSDKSYITIDIPIGFPKTGGAIPFVPLDSVFQTQDQAFLFVVKNGKAESRKVKLGQVLGSFVEVKSGLRDSDQVILNRNVIEGDPIKVNN